MFAVYWPLFVQLPKLGHCVCACTQTCMLSLKLSWCMRHKFITFLCFCSGISQRKNLILQHIVRQNISICNAQWYYSLHSHERFLFIFPRSVGILNCTTFSMYFFRWIIFICLVLSCFQLSEWCRFWQLLRNMGNAAC